MENNIIKFNQLVYYAIVGMVLGVNSMTYILNNYVLNKDWDSVTGVILSIILSIVIPYFVIRYLIKKKKKGEDIDLDQKEVQYY